MTKFLSIPDFHYSPAWANVSLQVAAKIKQAAIENQVDFIAFDGDTFNAPVTNTDKGGLNTLRSIFKDLLSVCPVVAIEGTPSHDGKGCYGVLEDLGVVLLKPNRTYGLFNKSIIRLVENTNSNPECIIFGVPELKKTNIQAKLKLSSTDATNTTLNLFKTYVESYIAPMRLKYNNVPAYGILHGNVSDCRQENSNDVILRESDLVIYTEDLQIANLTRWEFGHIHTPWESKIINGGYAGFTGIDSNPWGKRDFVPAMNLVDSFGQVTRIPYGTPMRVKISNPLTSYDSNVAYWLNSKDPKATLPKTVHPWSRITFDEDVNTTRRIDESQAKDLHTLADILKVLDPGATEKALKLINEIPTFEKDEHLSVDVKLNHVTIKGATFFKGNTIDFDLTNLKSVTSIFGRNGAGKSSLLAFCSPYPIIIGKDTQNRLSAISEFFNQKDSSIYKEFTVNGQKHEHLINIKGAHTKSSKVECYLTINGTPQLEKGTFDEMLEMCEKLYGSFKDYLLTSFYVQPLQSKKMDTSLMSADLKEVRNLVQNIAGIDRSKEKAYALEKAKKYNNDSVALENKIIGLKENLEDIDGLQDERNSLMLDKASMEQELKDLISDGQSVKEKLAELQAKKNLNDVEIQKQIENDKRIQALKFDVQNLENNIGNLKTDANNAVDIRLKIELSNQNYMFNNKIASIIAKNSELRADFNNEKQILTQQLNALKFEYQQKCQQAKLAHDELIEDFNKQKMAVETENQNALRLWQEDCEDKKRAYNDAKYLYESKKNKHEGDIKNLISTNEMLQNQINVLNKPCPNCGYIEPNIEQQINELNDRIAENSNKINECKSLLINFVEPVTPVLPERPVEKPYPVCDVPFFINPKKPQDIIDLENKLLNFDLSEPNYLPVEDKRPVLSDAELQSLQQKLNDINIGSSRIAEYQAKITSTKEQISELESKIFNIDYMIDNQVSDAQNELESKRSLYRQKENSILSIEKDIQYRIAEIRNYHTKMQNIKKQESDLELLLDDYKTWDYIAKMLNSNKIPALELELVINSIDAEATRIISVFEDGRFTFKTDTQNENGADKFDITVFDSDTGYKKSLNKFSPGEKAFISDAYVKALIRQRNSNGTRIYSPVVMDESDGPVQPELIEAYYDIQKKYWSVPVLVVSHNPTSHEFIENRINVEDLIK